MSIFKKFQLIFKKIPAQNFPSSSNLPLSSPKNLQPCRCSSHLASTNINSPEGVYARTLFEEYMAPTYLRPDILFTHGKGSYLYDDADKKYIDFCSGIAVTALGHADQQLNQVIWKQLEKVTHVSNLYHTLPSLELAKKLTSLSFADKVFFCNSGAEANEGAMKFARLYGKSRYKIISFTNGFHGRTLGALSATPTPKYQDPFGPMLSGIITCPFNDISTFQKLVQDQDDICGVMLEPIQGEGGVNPADFKFMKVVRDVCREKNILLILDEVQTGLGRTGKLFAYQHYFDESNGPDIVTLAKPLANGLPIGCILVNNKVSAFLKPGLHGSTFAGNPLVCAAALHVIERIVEKENLLKNVKERSEQMLASLKAMHKQVKEIKGKGLLIGIVPNCESKHVVDCAMREGLLVVGAANNTIRLLPPLNITKKEMKEGMEKLETALENAMILEEDLRKSRQTEVPAAK